jgi:hypothetical protein
VINGVGFKHLIIWGVLGEQISPQCKRDKINT